MSLQVHQIAVGGFDENLAYVVEDPESREAFVIDPSGNFRKIEAVVEEHDLTVVGILLTHTHPDHQDALSEALAAYPVDVFVHTLGANRVKTNDVLTLNDTDVIELGDEMISVLYTPGHNPDSVCYSFDDAKGDPQLITGDTLFVHGCGRTSEGGVRELYDSLQRLKSLPPETVIHPGHDYGPSMTSTIGHELEHNKYLLAEDFPVFAELRLGYTV